MAIITTILGGDTASESRTTINDNFAKRHGWTVRTVSADDDVELDDEVLFIDASGGDVNLTLPDVSDAEGRSYVFLASVSPGGNTITIVGTINGATNYTSLAAQYDRVRVISDGSEWFILSE